jgi:hydroxyacylglutathione hydrolase
LKDGRLPEPQRIAVTDLAAWIDEPSGVILDLRGDRKAFAAGHLQGSFFTPLAKGKLPSVAGSYVKEDAAILLVADANQVAGAVRQLIRIGLDRVDAWIPPEEAFAAADFTTSLSRIDTADLEKALQSTPDARVLDVRGAGEYAESHVKDALHIAHTRLAARLDEIDPAATWFIHCGSGLRASFAAAFLAREGRKVVHVDGDFEDVATSLLES